MGRRFIHDAILAWFRELRYLAGLLEYIPWFVTPVSYFGHLDLHIPIVLVSSYCLSQQQFILIFIYRLSWLHRVQLANPCTPFLDEILTVNASRVNQVVKIE